MVLLVSVISLETFIDDDDDGGDGDDDYDGDVDDHGGGGDYYDDDDDMPCQSVLVAVFEKRSARAADCMTSAWFSNIHITVFFILYQRK